MKAATALAAALGLWLCGTALAEETGPAPGTLNVLCGVDEDWCTAMEAAFERHSGLEISMTRLSTGEILDAIRKDRAAPTVDVWWGGTGDTHLQAAAEDLLEAYTSPHEKDLLPWAQNFHAMSGNLSSGVYAGALGFAYNKDLLAQRRLPAPSCWNDLTDPAYRGTSWQAIRKPPALPIPRWQRWCSFSARTRPLPISPGLAPMSPATRNPARHLSRPLRGGYADRHLLHP